jgi:hypothetical protein
MLANGAASTVEHCGWPELPTAAWGDTLATLHRWTQIVGKIRLTTSPPMNHWWQITLYVTPRGMSTSPMPYGSRLFEIEFDVIDRRLLVMDDAGRRAAVELAPKSVATFYRELLDVLRSLDIDVRIHRRPNEIPDAIPFDQDEVHRSYEPDHAVAFWRATAQAHRVMTAFRARFLGKASPVHFFWGGFDLAVTRFSGRRAPLHAPAAPNCPAYVMEEAYSHEVSSAGWWPLSPDLGPCFYSYMYPIPPGFADARVRPEAAFFSQQFGEFVLRYEDMLADPDPDRRLMEFLQSTYAAGADLAHWDRRALEPAIYPDERPPRHAWSTTAAGEISGQPRPSWSGGV